MGQKAMRKDFYMEIRHSLGRFLSIFLIVALGVAFFSGIRSAQPDMLITGDTYFDNSKLMDIQVISTFGITEDDIEALEQVDGVETAIGGYSMDVLLRGEENQQVFHIEALQSDINTVEVLEGRLPKNSDECLVDASAGYEIGDVIWVESGTDTPVTDSLKGDKFTVVGTGSSPCYISLSRGSTTIGTGSISGFLIVDEQAFCMDVYTEAYVAVEGARELNTYSDAYEEKVGTVLENIEEITGLRGEIRREELIDEATGELTEARQELEDGKREAETELADALQQITDGENQLSDAKAQVSDGESQIASAKITLGEKQQEIDAGVSQYEQGLGQYQEGVAQYEQGILQYQEGVAQYEQGYVQYEQGLAAYLQGEAEYEQQKALVEPKIVEGRRSLEEQRASLDEQWETYEQIKDSDDPDLIAQAEEMKRKLDAGEQIYQETEATLQEYQQGLDDGAAALEENKAALDAAKAELDANKVLLDQTGAALEAAKAQLDENIVKLNDAKAQLDSGQAQINEAWAELRTQESALADARAEIAEREPELIEAREKYEEEKLKAETEIADGEAEIADAEKEIEDIGTPDWYVNDRDVLPEYSGFEENANRMKAIGQVFPVLFFLVATLVSLTTMTRMVEEQRTQIGTQKALGYGKFAIASKYLGYAFAATLGGSVFGVLVGEKVIPYIIVTAYGIIYPYVGDILVPYNMYYAVMATGTAILCTMAATLFSCYRELASQPAILMRPPAPKTGKRVLLERVGFIWKHLSFSWKSTVRNLFRYKKRFFMTILGIGGSMAMILLGFGLKDSIFEIADIQYEEIQVYDGMAYYYEDVTAEEKDALTKYLDGAENVDDYLEVNMSSVTLVEGSKQWDVYMVVPENVETFADYVKLHDRITKESYNLNDEGVILNEKSAKELNLEVGDTVVIRDADRGDVQVKVSEICENYMGHYLYMSPTLFREVYGEEMEENCVYFKVADGSREILDEAGKEILSQDAVMNVSYLYEIERQLNDMLKSLNLVTAVLIVSAGMLAFVVLYNLNNINITERRRELATLKVLGFYDIEVSIYVYRENIILTLVGTLVGVALGILLHRFVIETVEIDSVMFGRIINFPSYLYSILFTVGFSIFVNWVMYFKLKKIDMVESLKSVE